MPISWSIRHYLIVLVLAMAIPLVGLLVYSMRLNYDGALNEARLGLRRDAAVVAADTARLVRGAEEFLTALAARPGVAALDGDRCDPLLGEVKQLFPLYAVVGVLDRSGQMLCASGRPSGTRLPNFGDFPWFQEARRLNGFHISAIHQGKVSRKWVSTFSVPIRDAGGHFNGLVGYSFDLESNPLLIARQNGLRQGETITIVDRAGLVLMKSENAPEAIGTPHLQFASLSAAAADNGEVLLVGEGDAARLLAIQVVAGTPWQVVAQLPAASVLDNLWLRANRQYLLAVLLVLLGTAGAAYVGSHITRPIQAIARIAARVAHGESDSRAERRGPREIVHVASQINRMLDIRLRAERQYQNLFESATDGIVVVNTDGLIALTNRRACQIFGYEPGALDGQPLAILIPEPLRARHANLVRTYLDDPEQRSSGQVVNGLRRDGTEVPCDITLSPLETDSGLVVSAFVRDLSEWTRMEAQLAFLSRHDPLTGLPNRSLLADRLSLAVARAQRTGGSVAVIHVDLDQFARINDFHGLTVADEVLKSCADVLRCAVREFETVVRSGSDEFVVLLESDSAMTVAEQFVERVRAGLAGSVLDETGVRVSASFGIALYPCEGAPASC